MDDMDMLLRLMRLKTKGFCCAQMILVLALEAQGKSDADLVRSVGGLCFGIGSGGVCGALAGGACLISLYAGKGRDEEAPDDEHMTMLVELADWFRGRPEARTAARDATISWKSVPTRACAAGSWPTPIGSASISS